MANTRILIGDPDAPAFIAGWANYLNGYQEAGYVKTGDGIVHLFGTVSGPAPEIGIFQLPAGYRPDRRLIFAALVNVSPVRVDVRAHNDAYPGFVTYTYGTDAQPALAASALSLAGISFLAVA